MRILNEQETRKILEKLFKKFKRDEKKYLNSFLGISTASKIIGSWYPSNLWSPEKNEKYIYEIYNNIITFDHTKAKPIENKPRYINKSYLWLIDFLKNRKEIKNLYVFGEWVNNKEMSRFFNRIVEFDLNEAIEINNKMEIMGDIYIIPSDLSWIYCITHENFSFLAGNKEFISYFEQFLPDYEKYRIDDPLYLGPNVKKYIK